MVIDPQERRALRRETGYCPNILLDNCARSDGILSVILSFAVPSVTRLIGSCATIVEVSDVRLHVVKHMFYFSANNVDVRNVRHTPFSHPLKNVIQWLVDVIKIIYFLSRR